MGELAVFLVIQVAVTWLMVGLICYSQFIHYPLYKKIKEGFVEYERAHIRRTAYLIGPLMLIEAISAVILVGVVSTSIMTKLAVINLVLLVFIWLATFLLHVYQHQKLSIRFSKNVFHNMISSNWIRTFLWIAKGVVMAVMVYFSIAS